MIAVLSINHRLSDLVIRTGLFKALMPFQGGTLGRLAGVEYHESTEFYWLGLDAE